MIDREAIEILGELKKCYLGGIVDAIDMAIEAVKVQEPVEPKKVNRYIDFDDEGEAYIPETYDCGACGNELPWKANYCPMCGRAVKWE